jgi:hypothetical protein
MFLEKLVTNVKLFFFNIQVDKILAIKRVNNDVMIPINNVVAKPLIGPEPNINKQHLLKLRNIRICN